MGRLLALAALGASAWAQTGFELYGHAGAGASYAGGWNFGDGRAAGAGAGVRLGRRWAIEGEYSRWSHNWIAGLGGFRLRGHADAVAGSAVLHLLPGRRAEPFFLAGAGTVHSAGRGYDPLLNFGAGVKVRLVRGFFLRPEVRLQAGLGEGRPGRFGAPSQARLQLGAGYRW